ncbi:head decoration protein [Lelliottia sp. SL45]|uniref:head decoration protein n=1 Tax=Lelliottia sp. SL45 TaxID=2994665 RepID=UPI002273E5FA|nr:head decoration protein [Lelliottia sp. SL45]MCY1698654.1 head decoration protein [Lelliottia sp. SL45]
MTFETRSEHRIFAGSDPAHTALGEAYITEPAPALTPLMLESTNGVLVPWDGANAGAAVGVLALDHDGISTMASYYKTGTFDINELVWPEGVSGAKKRNAFAGTAISVA